MKNPVKLYKSLSFFEHNLRKVWSGVDYFLILYVDLFLITEHKVSCKYTKIVHNALFKAQSTEIGQ